MKEYNLNDFSIKTTLDFKKSLNETQLQVVETAEGPCLVLAGAGSGKTRVLIYRLAWLLNQNVDPQNILLATFTNKAALQMKQRAESLIKSDLNKLWCGTFHHIGNITLRKEAHLLGYTPDFTIIDNEDSKDVIGDCLEELGAEKSDKLLPKKDVISNILGLRANCLCDIDAVVQEFYPHLDEYMDLLRKVYVLYEKKKKEANLMDFDDLLVNWLKVLQNFAVKEKYSQMFRYVLVDEYQDTNRLQFEILKILCSHHKNILAVGDDAQSIYSFRGAEINNILDFPKTFPGAKIFKLETNYRSSPQILTMANNIISNNLNQFEKNLQPIKKDYCLPFVIKTRDVYQQAKFVAQRIMELNQQGIPLNEMSVLFRSRFQAVEVEVEMIKRNIPYIIRGGVRFFEQAHIKDVFAYLKLIANPQDEIAFKRSVCLHKGIGRSYSYKIWDQLKAGDNSETVTKKLPKRQQEGFKEFQSLINLLKETDSPQKAIREIMERYKDYCYLNFENPDERMMEIEELAKMAHGYPSIKKFITDLNSYEDFKGETVLSDEQKNEVLILSTIHQAKGLEWEAVFLIGLNDHAFPNPKALVSQKAMEEERRLFYVAATRAKNLLHITYPQTHYTYKHGTIISRPSIFLEELPSSCYEEWHLQETMPDYDV